MKVHGGIFGMFVRDDSQLSVYDKSFGQGELLKNLTLRWFSRSGKGMGVLSLYLYIRRLLFLYLKQKKKLVLH